MARIIVLDDEELPRRFAMTVLMLQANYGVDTAHSPSQGMRQMRVLKYDLVITDYRMPEMNGVNFALAIYERYPNQRILMTTGEALAADEEAQKSGLTIPILEKPYTATQLIAKVAELLST